MAELTIDISKTAVQLVADKVKSAIKEEEEQWQTVERDLVFITGEFEMMQSFLDTANGERIRKHVVRTWVRQVRDLSYDVEDCIDFVLNLDANKRSWLLRLLSSWSWPWSKPRAARPVVEAVADIKLLKARIMDVSERNTRYSLISDGGSQPAGAHAQAAAEQMADDAPSTLTPTTRASGVLLDAAKSKSSISDVIDWQDESLRVVSAVSRAAGVDLGAISLIKEFYDNKRVRTSFKNRAWVKLMHPFNPHEFIRNLVAQFLTNSSCVQDENVIIGVDVLKQLEQISCLVDKFVQEVSTHRYLIVLEDVSSMEQWDAIKTYLPNRRNKSRIIVSTHHAGIARLCTGQPYQVSVLKQPSAYHQSHVFYSNDSDEKGRLKKQEQAVNSAGLFGRDQEIDELLELMKERRHISVWGPPGIGKTTLMKAVCDRSDFIRQNWVNVSDPFDAEGFSRNFAKGWCDGRKSRAFGFSRHLKRIGLLLDQRFLVVIDDLKSKQEWDFINGNIICNMPTGCCVVVITANESVATYCAQGSYSAVHRVKGLEADTAVRLFEEKASFMKDEGNGSPAEVWRLLSMCSGLPQFIITLAGHVAKGQRIQDRMVAMRLLNDNFMCEMQNNPNFACLKGVFGWLHSNFDASPQLLKKCIFYLSVFPRGSIIRRKRLVRRWSAEGFSGGNHWNSLEEAEMLIDKLIHLGVMQAIPFAAPAGGGGAISKKPSSCQVNSLFLDYIISRQTEEKTFLPIEVSIMEGTACSLFTQPMGMGRRHLAIRSSWERDEFDFNSLDLSRLRSLTVSGDWQPFFITEKMRVLRVLDLEGTSRINVQDESFKQIGFILPRLKYLSFRGCKEVSSLPESLGELWQLQTLDIRGTSVAKLPPSIVKLHKLQNICAGTMPLGYKDGALDKHKSSRWRRAREQLSSLLPRFRGCPEAPQQGGSGVMVPIGIEKLEALRTLSVVNAKNASGGEFALRDLKKLTKLSKLGVYGLTNESSREFWSLISGHKHMESLSMWGGAFPPRNVEFPPNLTKLTLDIPWYVLTPRGLGQLGALEKVRILRLRVQETATNLSWGPFGQLKILLLACKGSFGVNFAKGAMEGLEQLTLEMEASKIIIDAMEHLGKLRRLCSLCLRFHKFKNSTDDREQEVPIELQFGNKGCFGQLKVLEVVSKARLLAKFSEGTMEELEQLTLQTDNSIWLDGMNHLGKLKRLHTLRLSFAGMDQGQGRDLQFGEEQQASSSSTSSSPPDDPFGSLKVLEIIASTKLSGPGVKFAAGAMKKLMKLTLRTATLLTADDMKQLGKLKKLRTLLLDFDKCQDQEGELRFGEDQKVAGAGSSSSIPPEHFAKLKVLEIIYRSKLQVKFAENYAMKNLEQLKLHCLSGSSDVDFSWLHHHHLPLLKQVSVKASSPDSNVLMPVLERQLRGHQNKPVVKLELEPHSS